MSKPIFSTSESLQSAHDALVSSLTPTMPILMHGSGDVEPSQVDPATAHLVADLTATYVGQLVDAAVDAHDILTDGAGGIRPPPNFPRDDVVSAKRNSRVSMATVKQSGGSIGGGTKRMRGNASSISGGGGSSGADVVPGSIDDCWDDVEVPLPKVRKTPSTAAAAAGTKSALLPSRTMSTDQQPNNNNNNNNDDDVSADWAGLAGVDLFGPRRRVPYAGPPYAIETKSFIFPICHDATLYGRIMEVQKARRTIAPLLVDPILRDMVRGEGREVVRAIEAGRRLGEGEALVVGGAGSGAGAAGAGGGSGTASDGGGSAAAAASAAAGGGGADGGSGADTEIEKDSAIMSLRSGVADGAVWPGLGDLLPTYTTQTLAEAAADEVADGNMNGRKRKPQRVSFASKGTKST